MAMDAIITFRTTPEFKERVERLASETKRSVSYWCNTLLEERMEDLEDIAAADKAWGDYMAGRERPIALEDILGEFGYEG